MADMPKYQCNQQVSALQISEVKFSSEGGGFCTLTFEDSSFSPIDVTQQYVEKYTPQAEGYYVVYADGNPGYVSKDRFEAGYAKL